LGFFYWHVQYKVDCKYLMADLGVAETEEMHDFKAAGSISL